MDVVYCTILENLKEIDTKMKVRTKLSIILGLTIILLSLIITLFGSHAITSIVDNNSNILLNLRANLKVRALNEKLKSIFHVLQITAKEIVVPINNKGDEIRVANTLKNLKMQLNVVEGFMAVEDGTTYINDIGLLRGFNAIDKGRRWFLNVFEDKKKSFVGKPYFSVTTNNYVIPAGVEVVRNGKVVAVLCIDMDLGDIKNFISSLCSNKDYFLTDEKGTIFASKDIINTGKNIFKIFPEFKEYSEKEKAKFDFIWKDMNNQKFKMIVRTVDQLGWQFWQYESYRDIDKEYYDYLLVLKIMFTAFIMFAILIMIFVNNMLKKE